MPDINEKLRLRGRLGIRVIRANPTWFQRIADWLRSLRSI